MKSVVLAASMLAIAASAGAQQAVDHSHVHDAGAVAQAPAQPPAVPPAPAPGQPPAAPAGGGGRGGPQIEVPWNDAVPPGTADHAQRALKESSRHGEWADIKLADGGVLKSWVVYPERAQKAGVVLVIHDIRGLSDMARALGDQLAQDGFIAIVPDFLSGKGPNGGGTESLGSDVGQAIQGLTPTDVVARLNAAMSVYSLGWLPARAGSHTKKRFPCLRSSTTFATPAAAFASSRAS